MMNTLPSFAAVIDDICGWRAAESPSDLDVDIRSPDHTDPVLPKGTLYIKGMPYDDIVVD
jgi:hypothetical protein